MKKIIIFLTILLSTIFSNVAFADIMIPRCDDCPKCSETSFIHIDFFSIIIFLLFIINLIVLYKIVKILKNKNKSTLLIKEKSGKK